MQEFKEKLAEVGDNTRAVEERNTFLEAEVVRLSARCKDLVLASEIASEVNLIGGFVKGSRVCVCAESDGRYVL